MYGLFFLQFFFNKKKIHEMPFISFFIYDSPKYDAASMFFDNVDFLIISCYYFCPCFYQGFMSSKIIADNQVFYVKPSRELICFCQTLRQGIYNNFNITNPPTKAIFTDIKKMLLQCYSDVVFKIIETSDS